MATELKDKIITLEDLKLVYDLLKPEFNLPSYSSEDEGKVLSIQDGAMVWAKIQGAIVGDAVGYISNNNITLNGLAADTYTLYYEDENGNKLTDWKAIGTVEVQ